MFDLHFKVSFKINTLHVKWFLTLGKILSIKYRVTGAASEFLAV